MKRIKSKNITETNNLIKAASIAIAENMFVGFKKSDTKYIKFPSNIPHVLSKSVYRQKIQSSKESRTWTDAVAAKITIDWIVG